MKKITKSSIEKYRQWLTEEEKSSATVEKYIADVKAFATFLKGNEVTKTKVMEYKKLLMERYAPASVNAAISSINSYFDYADIQGVKVKTLKIQRRIFINKNKELSKNEYDRLLRAAFKKDNMRIYYLMQTVCSTGIRVSELKYITVEAINNGNAQINCKGKMRYIILPKQLCRMLKKYVKTMKIKTGSVFITKSGKPMDRSNIWSEMKKLCRDAQVSREKVFPHNLRHLFARTYYSVEKDIVRLADILGHSSINTTRIYTIETGEIHQMQIQKLGLLRC